MAPNKCGTFVDLLIVSKASGTVIALDIVSLSQEIMFVALVRRKDFRRRKIEVTNFAD